MFAPYTRFNIMPFSTLCRVGGYFIDSVANYGALLQALLFIRGMSIIRAENRAKRSYRGNTNVFKS